MALESYICEKITDQVTLVTRYKSMSKMEEVKIDLKERPPNDYMDKRHKIADKWFRENCPEGATYWYNEQYDIESIRLKECDNHEYKNGKCIHCGKMKS